MIDSLLPFCSYPCVRERERRFSSVLYFIGTRQWICFLMDEIVEQKRKDKSYSASENSTTIFSIYNEKITFFYEPDRTLTFKIYIFSVENKFFDTNNKWIFQISIWNRNVVLPSKHLLSYFKITRLIRRSYEVNQTCQPKKSGSLHIGKMNQSNQRAYFTVIQPFSSLFLKMLQTTS